MWKFCENRQEKTKLCLQPVATNYSWQVTSVAQEGGVQDDIQEFLTKHAHFDHCCITYGSSECDTGVANRESESACPSLVLLGNPGRR